MTRWTSADLAAVQARQQKPAKSKYGNKKTVVNGMVFASKREAARYQELKLMERAGEVSEIERQSRWDLVVNGQFICSYVDDFSYRERPQNIMPSDGKWPLIVEDVKGYKTPEYKIKRSLMKACHDIDIREVK